MDSYETLKKRYTDEEFIQSAAARRDALEYEKITFGKNLSPRKKYILMLLKDTHASFYIGNYPAVIAMCGMMLESMLNLKVKVHFSITKFIEYTRSPSSPVQRATTEEEIDNLQFSDLIGVCHKYNYLSNELFQDLRNIHKIRNITIHDKMPYFKRVDENYVFDIPGAKFPVIISRDSVKPLISDTSSLAAYYCLTRTRKIFHALIATIDD